MRITQRAITQTSLLGLNANLARIAKLQQQQTSGKQISRPSDSPTGTNTAMQVRQSSAAAEQYASNISDGDSWLSATDTALQSVMTQVRRVRDLTVQSLNTGSQSDAARTANATEVKALRESLLGLANQTVNGRPLFGGATTGSTAYTASGVTSGTFVGVGGTKMVAGVSTDTTVAQLRRVSDTEVLRVDLTGPEAFGDAAAGTDLFGLVKNIADHILTAGVDSTDLTNDLTALDAAANRLRTSAADIGARAARMDSAKQVNADLQLTLQTQLSSVEDIDLPKTIMELNLQQTGYTAALSATSKAIQPSLVDYLR